jgi:hypothetical protein
VEKAEDGKWHEVEEANVYGKEYSKYACTVIGRALVLSKLEEAAKLRATMSEESFKDEKCSYVIAAGVFDKRMGDVIYFWRYHLCDAESELRKKLRRNDDTVYIVVGRVTRCMEMYIAKEVELYANCKRK